MWRWSDGEALLDVCIIYINSLLCFFLATYKVISGWTLTCVSVHSWLIYSSAPLHILDTLAYSCILLHLLAYSLILLHTLAYSCLLFTYACILFHTLPYIFILWHTLYIPFHTLAYSCILLFTVTFSLAESCVFIHKTAYILSHNLAFS